MKYIHCEDWFVFATDEEGRHYYVSTEAWPLEVPISFMTRGILRSSRGLVLAHLGSGNYELYGRKGVDVHRISRDRE